MLAGGTGRTLDTQNLIGSSCFPESQATDATQRIRTDDLSQATAADQLYQIYVDNYR
jgi:hypothetical protein